MKNIHLAMDAKARVAKAGYWYGTYLPQTGTEALLAAKANQYPTRYTASYIERSRKWLGIPVCDCSGLVKGLYWISDFHGVRQAATDLSANGLLAACSTKGDIATIPETPGLLVWKEGHVGIYVCDGMAVESRGVDYGVVLTPIKDRGWLKWGKLDFIEYEDATDWQALAAKIQAELDVAKGEIVRLQAANLALAKQADAMRKAIDDWKAADEALRQA